LVVSYLQKIYTIASHHIHIDIHVVVLADEVGHHVITLTVYAKPTNTAFWNKQEARKEVVD
jgi:hypothetical protein